MCHLEEGEQARHILLKWSYMGRKCVERAWRFSSIWQSGASSRRFCMSCAASS